MVTLRYEEQERMVNENMATRSAKIKLPKIKRKRAPTWEDMARPFKAKRRK